MILSRYKGTETTLNMLWSCEACSDIGIWFKRKGKEMAMGALCTMKWVLICLVLIPMYWLLCNQVKWGCIV